MSFNTHGSVSRGNNPFTRPPPSSPTPGGFNRPRSGVFSSPPASGASTTPSHSRSQSTASPLTSAPATTISESGSLRHSRHVSTNTFAPSFIKAEETKRANDAVKGIEGENDFSGKRYVWLKDPEKAFVKGWVVEELDGDCILVQCDDGSVSAALVYSRGC